MQLVSAGLIGMGVPIVYWIVTSQVPHGVWSALQSATPFLMFATVLGGAAHSQLKQQKRIALLEQQLRELPQAAPQQLAAGGAVQPAPVRYEAFVYFEHISLVADAHSVITIYCLLRCAGSAEKIAAAKEHLTHLEARNATSDKAIATLILPAVRDQNLLVEQIHFHSMPLNYKELVSSIICSDKEGNANVGIRVVVPDDISARLRAIGVWHGPAIRTYSRIERRT